ncbi:MAG TPA: ATP-binding protein [Candidatus Angelobacter sp.]
MTRISPEVHIVSGPSQAPSDLDFLSSRGEMGERIRSFDWSRTSLGSITTWPQSLRTAVSLILNSQHPMWVGWGPQAIFLYNDAYIRVLSLAKHPWALGRPAAEVWAEIWDVCGPLADKVFNNGEPSFVDDVQFFMNRGDYLEETYYSFSYSPIRDESGNVGGLFCPSAQVTSKVLNARRLRTLSELSAAAFLEKSVESACASAARTLAKNLDDVPFTLLYVLSAGGEEMRLKGRSGLNQSAEEIAFPCVSLKNREDREEARTIAEVSRTGQSKVISMAHIHSLPPGPAQQKLTQAIVMPVKSRAEDRALGILVAAINPTRKLDEDYRTFYELVAGHVATAITNAQLYEEERKRAEALVELDRAKTKFFSNVSHEFRTPLTLMLAPLEELLAKSAVQVLPENRQLVDVAYRNGARLLKLVNTLLDFSRIEAGRVKALYKPTDLAAFTRELASVFRSATDRAGLKLKVECASLGQPVYVDHDMWEKIVLNLLSNAFKFTFEGEIIVRLQDRGDTVELRVEDTGVGIPEAELPRVFERFHRVEGTRGRSFEGSGIGLALVQELVKLHSGTISVQSAVGKGTTFRLSVPYGRKHLPQDYVSAADTEPAHGAMAAPYVAEALSWLGTPSEPGGETQFYRELTDAPSAVPATAPQGRVLLVDDNRDMRDYLQRLLSSRFQVITAANGRAALEHTRTNPPDLVLTDVMMPEMDGFELLAALRHDPATHTIPVILLSARAGEEATIQGLEQGADDYLIKPFSARELLTRVHTHLQLARARKMAADAVRESERWFRQTVETIPECVTLVAADGALLHMNSSGLAMVGGECAQDVIGKSIYDLVAPEDRDKFKKFNQRVCRGERGALEFDIVGLHGVRRHMETHAAPLDQPGGTVVQFAVTRDVTSRKEAEVAQRRLAAIVESSDDAIASKDLNGIVSSWNRSAERMFGYKAEEIIGRPITIILPPELQPDEETILGKIRRGEKIEHFETVRITKSGERVEVSLSISPIKDEHHNVIGAAKIVRDITEQKKIERALRTTEKLAAAGRLAATVAHEINNPLEAITNLVYLAQRDLPNSAKVANYLDMAKHELDRVAHIARQTLGFYRDTSSPMRFNVAQVLDDLLFLYEKRLETRNIKVVRQYDKEAEVVALPGEIRQAFSNFLSNSIDAMPTGGWLVIRVSRSRAWNNARVPGVRVTILDTGAGIKTEHRRNLFQPFFTTKADVGTGLGLWITRSIVEKHGGVIHVKSKTVAKEHGTVFSIFLPFDQKARHPQAGSLADVSSRGAVPTGVAGE